MQGQVGVEGATVGVTRAGAEVGVRMTRGWEMGWVAMLGHGMYYGGLRCL